MAKKAKQNEPVSPAPAKKVREMRPRVIRVVEETSPELPVIDDSGISLEDIGQAYASLLSKGDVPYEEPAAPTLQPEATTAEEAELPAELTTPREAPEVADEACELTPRSILEAILFVGHPANQPLTSTQIAGIMRGVTATEIDDLVLELNAQYEAEQCPYLIVSEGSGYRLTLHDDFSDLRERFYGRVKEARLSQAAIDTLSLVAYHQPITQKEVDGYRGKPSGGLLSQLVRRQLLQLERNSADRKEVHYRTTDRFLELFGLSSLEDLPRSQESDR
jgi:segregation and condensation protein B